MEGLFQGMLQICRGAVVASWREDCLRRLSQTMMQLVVLDLIATLPVGLAEATTGARLFATGGRVS